jgi:ribosomal protein L37AE/L43A
MDTPTCLKCGSTTHMVEQDSGLTYTSWNCTKCNVSRTKKNWVGKTIPFASLAIAILIGGGGGGETPPPEC